MNLTGQTIGMYGCEPLLPKLLFRNRFGFGGVFVGAAILYWIVPLVWAFFDRTLVIDAGYGLLNRRMQYMLVLPFLFAAVGRYYQESALTLDKLAARGVVRLTSPAGPVANGAEPDATIEQRLSSVLSDIDSSVLSRLAAPLPYATGLIVVVLFLLNGALPDSRPPWISALLGTDSHSVDWLFGTSGIRLVAYYYAVAFFGVGLAVLMTWAFSQIHGARVISRVLSDKTFDVRLNVTHPDGCMGLGPVSDHVRESGAVLVFVSFLVFLWTAGFTAEGNAGSGILTNPGFLTAWACYLILSPILFFGPLIPARTRMWMAKEQALADLGRKIADRVPSDESDSLVSHYKAVYNARVWPFTVGTVSSFFGSLTVPLIVTALPKIVGRAVTG